LIFYRGLSEITERSFSRGGAEHAENALKITERPKPEASVFAVIPPGTSVSGSNDGGCEMPEASEDGAGEMPEASEEVAGGRAKRHHRK
jgi:hypothetical protein